MQPCPESFSGSVIPAAATHDCTCDNHLMPDDDVVPAHLREPPSGPLPSLPPETTLQQLPFGDLRWEDFERLVWRLVFSEADVEESRLYGVRGQDQSGIDLYGRIRAGGGHRVYQCKRYDRLRPGDIRAAVHRFIGGDWSAKANTLVFCTSHSCVVTERAEVIEELAALLDARTPPVVFNVWDAEILALNLKDRPDLVREFFGRDALRRFNPVAYEAETVSSIEGSLDRLLARATPAVQIVDLTGEPQRLREAYSRLDGSELQQVRTLLGEAPTVGLVSAVVRDPPSGLAAMGSDVWRVIAIEAERLGDWASGATAWDAAAARAETDDARVRALGDGAAAAGIAGDLEFQRDLQERARAIDPRHPRVALIGLESMSPAQQLETLGPVSSDDPGIQSLIHGHRVLAHLMLGDVRSAERDLEAAKGLTPDTATVQMLAVNVEVQRGRLDLIAHRPLRGSNLEAAISQAASARESLANQRRYGEALRVRMLESDAHLLLDDRRRAARILADASPEELAEPDASEVLGDAALRALDFGLALRLTEGAPPSDAVSRIHAAASLEVGSAVTKRSAVATLDALIDGGGPEANEAAFLRLHASLASDDVPWSDVARDRLASEGHRREATILEASHLAMRRHDVRSAVALLREKGDPEWSHVWAMRLLLTHGGSNTDLENAAGEVILTGPSQAIRVECGRAFARAGDFGRAEEVLISVARDPAASIETRAEAYHYLVRVSGVEQNAWRRAGEHLDAWIALAPGDSRASQWMPTVANRRRQT